MGTWGERIKFTVLALLALLGVCWLLGFPWYMYLIALVLTLSVGLPPVGWRSRLRQRLSLRAFGGDQERVHV